MSNHDVILHCVFERHDAVCHLCATRTNRLGDLLDGPFHTRDRCHESVSFVDVKCAKICCCVTYLITVGIFSKGPEADMTIFLFWASLFHTTTTRKKLHLDTYKMPKNFVKTEGQIVKEPKPARHLVLLG